MNQKILLAVLLSIAAIIVLSGCISIPPDTACVASGGSWEYSECNGHCVPETSLDRIECEAQGGCACTTVCIPGNTCVCQEGYYWGSKLEGCIASSTACTAEAKICPGGSTVVRIAPDCEFPECPETSFCDALTPCPSGTDCYSFPGEEKAQCFSGDPCTKCASGKCVILESYPAQVKCIEETKEDYCTEEQRQADACIALYQPVCGWFDPQKVVCAKYPCAGNYSNSCLACKDEKILYWTEGNCPNDVKDCAEEGESFSAVFEKYPSSCCAGLYEWNSGMDSSISIGINCYETGLLKGSPVGTCLDCGNRACDELEDVCSCPVDCAGGQNADYSSAQEFCDSELYKSICNGREIALCNLCEVKTSCSDSDGGKNHYEKGTVKAVSSGQPDFGTTETDYCASGETLVEWYCENNAPQMEAFECESSKHCLDGACVSWV